LLLFSSVSVEHRHDQNGNGRLVEKPASPDVMPMNAYDNPMVVDPHMIDRASDYMSTPPNGQCHHLSSLTISKTLLVLTSKLVNLNLLPAF